MQSVIGEFGPTVHSPFLNISVTAAKIIWNRFLSDAHTQILTSPTTDHPDLPSQDYYGFTVVVWAKHVRVMFPALTAPPVKIQDDPREGVPKIEMISCINVGLNRGHFGKFRLVRK